MKTNIKVYSFTEDDIFLTDVDFHKGLIFSEEFIKYKDKEIKKKEKIELDNFNFGMVPNSSLIHHIQPTDKRDVKNSAVPVTHKKVEMKKDGKFRNIEEIKYLGSFDLFDGLTLIIGNIKESINFKKGTYILFKRNCQTYSINFIKKLNELLVERKQTRLSLPEKDSVSKIKERAFQLGIGLGTIFLIYKLFEHFN